MSLADQIIEEFLLIAPVRVSFDPMVKFGPGERMVNDGEDMLVNAGHRITQNLHCATNFTHHVSKDVARNGIVDHHSGRGGSALGDGVRAAYQLLTITPDIARNYPGAETHHSDIADGRLLAFHITKLTDAKRPLEPIILRRNGWLFEPVAMPDQAALEIAIKAAQKERARRNVEVIATYLKERPYHKFTRRKLEALHEDMGIARNAVRAAIEKGLMDLVLAEVALPSEEQHGAKKPISQLREVENEPPTSPYQAAQYWRNSPRFSPILLRRIYCAAYKENTWRRNSRRRVPPWCSV